MRILNLYAGLGGNRKLWTDVEVTAVEMNKEVAAVYRDYFPNDKVIVGDAHKFLLNHINEYDFIWSSPPCPTHSKLNTFGVATGQKKLAYPDMKLYEEIILLRSWFKGLWVVENVIPYYEPLIPAKKIDRHLFWSNFNLGFFEPEHKKIPHKEANNIPYLEKFYGYDLSKYKLGDKRQKLRNCVHPETGLYILNCAMNKKHSLKTKQTELEL